MLYFLALVATVTAIILFLHWYSYSYLKAEIVARRSWDLNICCGTIDGGGVNVDIVQHADVPNFVKVDDIYRLPFADQQFDTVLCSHTIEHVDYPRRFDRELRRVAREVVYVLPPVWDLAAALNVWERLSAGPAIILYGYLAALGALVLAAFWLIWRFVVRRQYGQDATSPQRPLSRAEIESRLREAGELGVAVGALVTTILFLIGRQVLTIYLERSGTLSLFGTVGAVVVRNLGRLQILGQFDRGHQYP